MSAQTDSDLAKVASGLADAAQALGALRTDIAADGGVLTDAQQALAKKTSDLTAALTESGRLLALLVKNNIDPSGGTTPPPATATIGPASYDPVTHFLKVPFSGLVASKIARTGRDSGGYGEYDTTQSPPSFLAAANAAHAIQFSGMDVPGQTVVVTIDGTKGEHLTISWTLPAAPGVAALKAERVAGSSSLFVTWDPALLTPVWLQVDGSDIGGTGVWNTDMASPPGVPAAAVAAGRFEFLGRAVPGTTYTISSRDHAGNVLTVKDTAPGSPPPPPPPSGGGRFKLGYYGVGGVPEATAFGANIAHREIKILHQFLAGDYSASTMAMFLDGQGFGPWLAVDPTREFVVAYQAFYGHTSSDWDNLSIDARAIEWANLVTAKAAQYGFNPGQIVCRLMHEGNGNWGFGQARYGGDQTAGFIRAWRRIRLAVRAVQPAIEFDWNNVAFAYGSIFDPRQCYPGDDVVDRVTFDFYADYGDFSTKLPQLQDCAAFAVEHKKKWGIDEWCLCRSTNGRGGTDDDPVIVTKTFESLRDLGASWLLIFNEDWNDETRGTFEKISRDGGGKAIEALQTVLATIPA